MNSPTYIGRNLAVVVLIAFAGTVACSKPSVAVQSADAAPDETGCACTLVGCPNGASFRFDIPAAREELLTAARVRVCVNETRCVERTLKELTESQVGKLEFANEGLTALFENDGRRLRVGLDYEPVQRTDRFRVTIADDAGVRFESATHADVAIVDVFLNSCSNTRTHEPCERPVTCHRAEVEMLNEVRIIDAGLDANDGGTGGDT